MINFTDISSKFIERLVKKRNDNFDSSTTDIYKSHVPVISIGNLTFGGSGKTPLTISLAKELISRGYKPGIIGKGYKRTYNDISIISDGERILTDWHHAGDEMFLTAKKVNAPVVVHKQKFQAAKLTEKFDIDVMLLDDGFQHRYLHREIDLVLIDKNTIEHPWLPPKGRLREPVESLSRAHFLIAEEGLTIPDVFSYYFNHPPIRFRIESEGIYDLLSKKLQLTFKDTVIAFSAIAHPRKFINTLNKQKIKISITHSFRDHHKYQKRDILKLAKLADNYGTRTLITTEKDAVKLEEFSQLFQSLNLNIFVQPITLSITEGKDLLMDSIIDVIDNY